MHTKTIRGNSSGFVAAPMPVRSIVLTLLFCSAGAAFPADGRKLIEFGWDQPDTAFLRLHAAELDASPFDGCVIGLRYKSAETSGSFTGECWGNRAFKPEELAGAMDDLRTVRLKRMVHNFIRVNVTPG